MNNANPVRVRFAPSPTGDLHIGGVRTAQFNWMFARRYGGQFILRIEDTDQKRTKEESLSGIMEGLRWAGLNWDEGPDIGGPYGPYIQSERIALYQQWANWLVDQDKAYRAYETPEELESISKGHKGYDRRGRNLTREDWARLDAEGRPYVIRFKVPLTGETTFTDMVRGPITYHNDTLQDTVILKSDGWPTYHLAHIVDDHFMQISHVIRAEEWIPSTPLHTLIYAALGWEMPNIAHVPVILAPDGGKISKRKHPEAAISYFWKNGYLPDAVTNYLCNVGWNYGVIDEKGEEVQVFTKEDAAKIFDVTRVTASGTKFDMVKLAWLNGVYIRNMDALELAKHLRPVLEAAGFEVNLDVLLQVVPLIRERIKTLTDIVETAGFFFTDDFSTPAVDALTPKKMTAAQTAEALTQARAIMADGSDSDPHAAEEPLRALAEQMGLKPGQLFGAIRVAVTGQAVSPPLFESIAIIGKGTALTRIDQAIAALSVPS